VSEEHERPARINIFPLADPQVWAGRPREMLKTLVSAIDPGLPRFVRPEYDFRVDPVSGRVSFTLENDLWLDRPKRQLPRDAAAALKAARDFIARLCEACRGDEYRRLKAPPLLPSGRFARVVPLDVSPVFHFERPWVDHWLCRFEVRLKAFPEGDEMVRVFGGDLDIRVGQRSRVAGFASRWRPALLDEARAVEMLHPEADDDHHHGHEGQKEQPPELVYELSGENCPQNFVTPYYLSLQGHHGSILPASSHSLLVEVGCAEKEGGGAYVVPRVAGGSGDYVFDWACWRPDALFDEGLVGLGTRDYVELPPGVFNVMLHVRDRRTGVMQMHESMAFVKGGATEAAEPESGEGTAA
jgi:hypothetical protein